jgi:tetratricopeptide (TPR) repeat protein
MYELLFLFGFGLIAWTSFTRHSDADLDIPHKISDKMGKLWDIVHQGMRENRLLRAEKALLTILKIDEKNAAAYNRLGILYAKQKEYRDAIDCFEIACSIEPTASSLHNLGLIYYETENYDKSVTAFEEALKMEDTLAARHIALAKALEKIGNHKAMLDELEKAAEIEPNHETFSILAKTYRSLGIEDKADIYEDKIKKIKPPATATTISRKHRIRRPKRVVI